MTEHFWNVFIIDAFLDNFDRHNGNWGFIYNEHSRKADISPVYDCGSCLLPQADSQKMKLILGNRDEMNAKVFNFPTSAIKFNGKKINYYDFLIRSDVEDCSKTIMRITPRIDMEKISEFIDSIPFLSELQKEFYVVYIDARYEKIIVTAYEHALELRHGQTEELSEDMDYEENFEMTIS